MGLGSYKGSPFVTGSWSPHNIKTELVDYDSNQWMEVADFPYAEDQVSP